MKVLFLDFDGVLNTDAWVRQQERCDVLLQEEKLALVKDIVDACGAQIVLSTSWREHWSEDRRERDAIGDRMDRLLRSHGLTIFDKLPHRVPGREKNLLRYLADHPEVEDFAILDDQAVSDPMLRSRQVRTSPLYGLQPRQAEDVIRILKREGMP